MTVFASRRLTNSPMLTVGSCDGARPSLLSSTGTRYSVGARVVGHLLDRDWFLSSARGGGGRFSSKSFSGPRLVLARGEPQADLHMLLTWL